jgi:ferrous iron transport protein B
MHAHNRHGAMVEAPSCARRIVLVGNPNVGKSVFFNALTGLYVDVSNFPGTTVEITQGRWGDDLVIDTPGIYGVASFNDEERVARDILVEADAVVNIVDAVHLERDLFLTVQLIDMGIPLVIALNMMDEAESQGLKVDADLLERSLGVPVVPTAAVHGRGMAELKAAIPTARTGATDPVLAAKLMSWYGGEASQRYALLAAEGDGWAAHRAGLQPMDAREELYIRRRQRVNDLISNVVVDTRQQGSFAESLSHWMIQPLTGIPILAGVLVVLYLLIGNLIAQQVVNFTEKTVMRGMYEPFVRGIVEGVLPSGSPVAVILSGEFGLLTMTVTYLVGLLLPLVIGFYIALSIMEDSGYLPRLATLVDRALVSIGLNGRAIVPLILGLGCVTMATMTTRILGSQRERRIAVALLGLTIPCSAQLAVITAMLAGLGAVYAGLYGVIIVAVLALAGTVLNWLMPGKSTGLLIDLPPLRIPQPLNVLRKTLSKVMMFLSDAGPLFAIGAVLLSVLQISGALVAVQSLLAPLTVGWMHLPKEASTAFVMGFVRRDYGAAGLMQMNLTPAQTVVALVTVTLFVPCIASVMMLVKERGWREATVVWVGCLVAAFALGGALAQVLI